MKKKQYIQPELLVVTMSSSEIVCSSFQYSSSNSNKDTGYNEAEAGSRRGSGWSDYEGNW